MNRFIPFCGLLFLVVFPCYAQEWTQQDSLQLQKLLQQEGELKLNPEALRELEMNTYGSPQTMTEKSWMKFDDTLPEIPSPLSKNSFPEWQITMPLSSPPSESSTPATSVGTDLMRFFTKEFWSPKVRKRRARTLEVLKGYGTTVLP